MNLSLNTNWCYFLIGLSKEKTIWHDFVNFPQWFDDEYGNTAYSLSMGFLQFAT